MTASCTSVFLGGAVLAVVLDCEGVLETEESSVEDCGDSGGGKEVGTDEIFASLRVEEILLYTACVPTKEGCRKFCFTMTVAAIIKKTTKMTAEIL